MLRRKVVLQSPRAARKKRNRRILILASVLFIFGGILTGIYFFLRAPFLVIKDVSVSGTEVLDSSFVSAKAKENMEGSIYFFLPKNNIFFYPKKMIQDDLLKTFPRIDTLQIKIQNNVLNITLKEKAAFALWCKNVDCYFIDSTGFIFAKAPEFGGNVYKVFTGLVELEGEEGALGKQFLSIEMIQSLKKVYEALEEIGIDIAKINVLSLKETRLVAVGGTAFVVDIPKISDEIIQNLRTVLASDEFNKKLPALKGVEYIDVRFGGKVFFKLRSGVVPIQATSTKAFN